MESAWFFYLLFAFLSVLENTDGTTPQGGPVAKTQFGPVKGIYADEAAIFFGLPFSMAPVGALRWKPPQPYNTSWAPQTYDATFPRPGCWQNFCPQRPDFREEFGCPPNGTLSEDCLHLNIFTPLPFDPSVKLPAAIWFPGMRYRYGSATNWMVDGRFLANKTKSIVVTTNYRLGALGFLVAGQGEGAATGNYGTLDQIAAMEWVQSNIGSFGGDKDQVTIMGQSSGADSVALHLMAENTEHLFKRAVMMSIPFIAHKTRSEALELGNMTAKLLNCTAGNMTCFRSAAALDVIHAQIAEPFSPSHIMQKYVEWGPYVDGNILKTADLQDMFFQGKFQKKPLIIGTTTDEAFPIIYDAFRDSMTESLYQIVMLSTFMAKAPLVLKEYPPVGHQGDERQTLSRASTDHYYTCPARRVIRSATQFGLSDVWLYHFDQLTEANDVNLWAGFDQECYGHVCHASDVPFLFQTLKLAGLNVTDEEQNTTDSMAYYFGNFIHTGDPNNSGWRVSSQHQVHPGQQQPSNVTQWPRYNKLNNYVNMKFTPPASQLETAYMAEKCDFWDSIHNK